jgi:predicted membrane protein
MITYDESKEQQGHPWCRHHHHGGADSRIFIGILLVATGVVLIAENLNLLSWEMSHILISWPMLLVAVGLFNLARKHFTPGYVFTAIGLFFLTPRILDVPENFYRNFWPAILIVIGVIFLLQWKRSPRHFIHTEKNKDASIDETAIFGGRDVTIANDNFTGGKVTSIFGGSKINLLYAKPAPDCVIDVANIFGGTKFIVPEDWNVKVEVASIFGGFEDRRSPSVIARSDPNKTVVIKGSCIFGGGEVTSMP